MHRKITPTQLTLEDAPSPNFVDDIDGLAEEEEELVNLVNRLYETSANYGIEISAEKNKIMTNSSNTIKLCNNWKKLNSLNISGPSSVTRDPRPKSLQGLHKH